MNEKEKLRIDNLYKNTPLENIPWNSETPPELLVELIDTQKLRPCKAIDLGCGAGNYAIYLASRGFEVTGIDFSPAAIKLANKNANAKNISCNFLVANVLELPALLDEKFDFAYDWGLLHHILPKHRQKYVENVSAILKAGARYLSVCFSEKDTGFSGSGKYRKTNLGTTLYFSSEDELGKLFQRYFHIIDLRSIRIEGKFEPHIFNYVFMEKIRIQPTNSP